MKHKANYAGPGRYRIEVQGELPAGWGERFGAMKVYSRGSERGDAVTVLQGCVADQAELSGILNTLYELHLTLLSVRLQDDAKSGQSGTST